MIDTGAEGMDPLALKSLLEESSRYMLTGIDLLERQQWKPALRHFDHVVKLRNQLPWREESEAAWMLAAAWINRGDALIGLGCEDLREKALHCFDQTLLAMEHVSLEEHPAYPERSMLAWIKRATCCGEMGRYEEALRNFSEADGLLDRWGRNLSPTRSFLEAMLLVNLSRVQIEIRKYHDAREAARKAVILLRPLDAASSLTKAWSLECRSLALMLENDEFVGEDWIAEATDAVEEALAWVKSVGYLEGWEADLVRYGAKIYRACQPQFLAEFLGDWLLDGPLAGDTALREEMKREVLVAKYEVEQRVLAAPHRSDYVQGQIVILKSLQDIASQLS
ncbi:MAG: tetratricopeptide repeat protein [Luteolibacter sp.]